MKCEYQKGETVVIKIPFKGYPHPTSYWTKDGIRMSSTDNIQMETTDRFAILTLKNTTRDDNGAYRVVVENELGYDSATINVVICGEKKCARPWFIYFLNTTFVKFLR